MAEQTPAKMLSSPRKRGSSDFQRDETTTRDSRLRGNDEQKQKPTRVRLGDITDSCLGKMLDKEKNRGIYQPYLANLNVRWGGFDLSSLNEMRFELDEEERYGLKFGDLVVCEGGEPGRCAIWREERHGMKFQKALHRLRAKDGYSVEYLFYRMILAGRTGELAKHFIGSTIKHLTGIGLAQVEFEFPELAEQQKIAAVLSALDAKIDLNQRINTELEALAKTIYDYWFVQFDFPFDFAKGRPDAHGRPYKSSGGAMVWNDTLKREIPAGWTGGVLSDIANITMGQSPAGDSYNQDGRGVVFFQGSTDFGIRSPQVRMYTTSPARMAGEGDILVSVRAPVGTLNIADRDCCIGRGLAALNSKSGSAGYLYWVMADFKQVFDRRSSEGTTFGSITKDDLFGLKVLIPDAHILQAHARMANDWIRLAALRDAENRELTRLRDWLLPLLMNGQVCVA